jgi:hypothetical protein
MKTTPLRIVVSGMLAGVPRHGGATWAVLQYVLGLRNLGHDVFFVEPLDVPGAADGSDAENGSGSPAEGARSGSPGGALWTPVPIPPETLAYFNCVTRQFGLQDRAALLVRATRETAGVPYPELLRFVQDADLVLNLSGLLREPELLEPVPLRVYVDLDPAFTQLWHEVDGIDMGFAGHDRFVTVGLSLGRPECPIPTCDRDWITTLQPVVMEEWPRGERLEHDALTTVANWRGYGSTEFRGMHIGQKAHALRRFLAVPGRAEAEFVLALGIAEGDRKDREALEANGWRIVDPLNVACSPDRYRDFIRGSRGEFGVAKTGYTESRSGWFSDRSACYLAAGRPVLAQETGFSRHLPAGRGLLAFDDEEGLLAGVESLYRDYDRHATAARELAGDYFSSDRVLGRLLDLVQEEAPSNVG